ncbi:MAG: CDP-glycerol glycerophosphotransferase family protein [Clostridia bacterium]|nr:CDP-glycerol glycerophosphotransferase family protein [Clostridia bacterium]
MKVFKLFKRVRKLKKDKFWVARHNYVKYYETLPIDERAILLESTHGKKLDGNIYYILRYLATDEKYKDYKIYLSSMGRYMNKLIEFLESRGIQNVNVVMMASDEYMRLLASAKYLINDTSFGPYFAKKEGQIYLNTWHGTPLKTLGRSDASEFHTLGNIQRNFVKSDFLLYPNEYTRDIMLEDYMLENIAGGRVMLSGYPRNEIFFDEEARARVRDELMLEGKRTYVYMPTYRGQVSRGKTSKSTAYLVYYLFEMEKMLGDDEVLFVNLHPLATDAVNFSEFNKIKPFPKEYEVYEFLNAADVLITDYSSVFFDFAVTGKKTVLFTYDEEEYLATRGMYMNINELPFPRVYDLPSLFEEIRSEKNYDDKAFLEKFCPYESINASRNLCDCMILGDESGVVLQPIADNGKENVFIYAGNLSGNGITASLISLLHTVDLEKRNYIVTFRSDVVGKYKDTIKLFPKNVKYYAFSTDPCISVKDRIIRKLFREKLIKANLYMKLARSGIDFEFKQFFGNARIDSVIQFNGYEADVILLFSAFKGNNTIFVHSNVVEEITKKGNQRRDVLNYAYRKYRNVAVVTEDMIAPTKKISGRTDNIKIVKNTVRYKEILEKSGEEFTETSYASCSLPFEKVREALESTDKKFINIGRFAPEKAQDRLISAFSKFHAENPDSYLFIIGGYSLSGVYEKLSEQISNLGLSERIILIMNMENPYTVLKKCDYFVLSSLYEGFGLVLIEADILGKPVISTDIPGPRTFMERHGGMLVDDSEQGVLSGIKMLAEGKIKPLNVDYKQYNEDIEKEFEALFD